MLQVPRVMHVADELGAIDLETASSPAWAFGTNFRSAFGTRHCKQARLVLGDVACRPLKPCAHGSSVGSRWSNQLVDLLLLEILIVAIAIRVADCQGNLLHRVGIALINRDLELDLAARSN